jgi:hypothetical protein
MLCHLLIAGLKYQAFTASGSGTWQSQRLRIGVPRPAQCGIMEAVRSIMLRSKLLSSNDRLQACEVQDLAHVKTGDQGDFVNLIQQALAATDDADIDEGEVRASRYGKSTASAVLNYKTKRQIINRAYQNKPDDIVGKMTIKRLDDEMAELESQTTEFFAASMRNARGRIL